MKNWVAMLHTAAGDREPSKNNNLKNAAVVIIPPVFFMLLKGIIITAQICYSLHNAVLFS